MSFKPHSFGWLLRNHPAAHATILEANGGERDAAAENWESIQHEIYQREVMEERIRCCELLETAKAHGDVTKAFPLIRSGAPSCVLPECDVTPVRAITFGGELPMAQGIVDAALRGGGAP